MLLEKLSPELLARYKQAVPRYTSYPVAPVWGAVQPLDVESSLARTQGNAALYVHFPFCPAHCFFCACNSIVVRQRRAIADYLTALKKELSSKAPFLRNLCFTEIQFGGGSPSSLTAAELSDLIGHIKKELRLTDQPEIGIELHPNHFTEEHFQVFLAQGFNRFSIGVQDFNSDVQEAIGRVHAFSKVAELVHKLRLLPNLQGINFDLVYGLPKQNRRSFWASVEQVLDLQVERAAVFNYAHMPKLKPLQKNIDAQLLPAVEEKTAIFCQTVEQFVQAGYLFIGLDHFSKPSDKLSQALHDGRIYRNFMGYTASRGLELIGIGATAISEINGSFFQNCRKLIHYYRACAESPFPIEKGHLSSSDDFLRREIILSIMCRQKLCFADIEQAFQINFSKTFAAELDALEVLLQDELIELNADSLTVTATGRFFIRNICAVFDAYLAQSKKKAAFSQAL